MVPSPDRRLIGSAVGNKTGKKQREVDYALGSDC